MAEQNEQPAAEGQEPEKKGLPIKTILVLVIALVIEGAAISGVFMMAGGPEPVQAQGAADDEAAEMERPIELLACQGRFQNTRTGRAYLYDTSVYIVIKKKYEEQITQKIEMMQAQIDTDVAKIFRKAEPSHLLEPELSTITRQIKSALDGRFGQDEDVGESIVQEVLIPKCQRFRSDA